MSKKTKKLNKKAMTGSQQQASAARASSIKTKILIPISILTIVILVSGLLNILSMRNMQESSSQITSQSLPIETALETAIADFNDLQRLIYAHSLAEEKVYMEEYQEKADTLFAEIDDALNTYEAGITSEEDAALVTEFRSSLDSYKYTYETVEQLSYSMLKQLAQSYVPNLMQSSADDMQEMLQTMKANIQEQIAQEEQEQYNSYILAIIVTLIATVVGFLVAAIAYLSVNRSVIKPVKRATNRLDQIVSDIQEGHGDLTARIDVNSRDEVGRLSSGINVFLETLQNIMGQIVSNAENLGSVVNTVFGSVDTASGNASDISSLLQELSATMQEISSTTTNVNDEINSVGEQVASIAGDTATLNSYAAEMESRAKELEQAAQHNRETTGEIIGDIIASLEEAIEESKSVSKVNDLTDEILNVSSQTNLLALNASIEAARAGDAGKGFAVVANEIRTLADSTRETAGNIQEINGMVVRAVDALVENSNAIVNYVTETIMPDYERFVETGKQYRNDASYVNNTMNTFEERANSLKMIMLEITEAVNGITKAIEESAIGVTSATTNTTTLVSNIEIVNQEMGTNQQISLQLKREADRFISL
jgi:methyl-accepting chemotaxis protein